MGKYWMGFKLALSNEFIYRTNFLVGKLGEFVAYAGLLYLFHALPQGAGAYDQTQLLTYVIGAAFISSFLFVYGMHGMSEEITEGDLVNYLLRPIHYLWFWLFRLAGTRVLSFVAGMMEVALLILLVPGMQLFWQTDFSIIFLAILLLIGSFVMIQLIDFLAGMCAFWAYRSHGPRWMITTLILFLSGSYFPLDLLPPWAGTVLSYTPFPTLIFAPLKTYLGQMNVAQVIHVLELQIVWIVIFLTLVVWCWKRGVKKYEAYGG